MRRRDFLAASAAASVLAAGKGWAAAGGPDALAAARTPEGRHVLCGLRADGRLAFRLPLPARGHAAAAHPTRPLAVAFARRPGDFALVIDCAEGREIARLRTPEGRHFQGHGAFDAAGHLLFTTENAYEAGEGRLGVWDARTWTRIDEIPSHGVGPHEVIRVGDRLVVANGGILTHPAAGRAKLNLPEMRPNLARLSPETGALLELVEPEARHLSIRHIAAAPDGEVLIGMQWQGALDAVPPLLALHREGEPAPRPILAEGALWTRLRGYIGSVALSRDGARLAATGPRGSLAMVGRQRAAALDTVSLRDVCGAATIAGRIMFSTGQGDLMAETPEGMTQLDRHHLAWDNHLVALT